MKKLLYSLILLLCTTAVSASAETAIEARADFENSRIVVNGTTEPNSEIPLMLFKDFGSSVLTPDNIASYAEHVTSVSGGADGAIPETSLVMVPTGAWFKLFAGDAALSGEGIRVYYPTQAEFDAAKLAINGATAETIVSVMATHGNALGVDLASGAYTGYTQEFCRALLAKRPAGGWTYISDEAQAVTFQKDFESVKSIYNRYVEALDKINGSTRETLTDILNSYNDILGLTLTGKYASYSSEINRSIASVQYANLEAFKSAFNTAVNNYKAPQINVIGPSSSNGGGGGGGAGGGFGGMAVEVTKPADATQPQPEPEYEPFSDIASVNWAKESIIRLSDKGIIAGVGNGVFNPDGNVTREQFVKMLVLALELPESADNNAFTDVSDDMWYTPFIKSAFGLGIATGKDDGSFGIGESITREDMAVMVLRAVNAAGAKLNAGVAVSYRDETEFSSYAAQSIKELGKAGIITGMPDGTYMPKNYSTRAQAAVILDRLMQNVKG